LSKLGTHPNIKSATSLQQNKSVQYGKLHKLIVEFNCHVSLAYTFERGLICTSTIEGGTSSDELIARLLISKLSGPEYSKMAQKLMPRKFQT